MKQDDLDPSLRLSIILAPFFTFDCLLMAMKQSCHVEESKEVSQEVALLDSVIFGISYFTFGVFYDRCARSNEHFSSLSSYVVLENNLTSRHKLHVHTL